MAEIHYSLATYNLPEIGHYQSWVQRQRYTMILGSEKPKRSADMNDEYTIHLRNCTSVVVENQKFPWKLSWEVCVLFFGCLGDGEARDSVISRYTRFTDLKNTYQVSSPKHQEARKNHTFMSKHINIIFSNRYIHVCICIQKSKTLYMRISSDLTV